MSEFIYFPCSKSGKLLRGFCRTHGSFTSYSHDLLIWKSLGVSFVSLNGVVSRI